MGCYCFRWVQIADRRKKDESQPTLHNAVSLRADISLKYIEIVKWGLHPIDWSKSAHARPTQRNNAPRYWFVSCYEINAAFQ